MTRTAFEAWCRNLVDANVPVCVAWFGESKTWDAAFAYLMQDWTRDEVAAAWMA